MSKRKTVSFSQTAMYNDCQYKWYLSYVKKLGSGDASINLIFGSAMHTVLQAYLKILYENSAKEADSLDLNKMLYEELSNEFTKSFKELGKYPCTKDELMEFYIDGLAILEFFKNNRSDYFSKKGYELLGIEIPLEIEMPRNTMFTGFIDVAIKDTISGKVKIIDFKTSTMGWRDYQKNDENKTSQIILYKKFYSEIFNISENLIDVEFIILKRKLYENTDYPQKRIQRFTPASGKPTINKVMSRFNKFIEECFTESGEYELNRAYLKASESKKCKFCEFLNNEKVCGGIKSNTTMETLND